MDLQKFIYAFNLVTTLTVTERSGLGYIINNQLKEVDYSNSISFYELVELFNKQYVYFKKDYEALEKINFGEYIQFLDFDKENDYRNLRTYIDTPTKEICDKDETLLYFVEEEGKLYSYVSNDIGYFDEKYYRDDVHLEETVIRRYLDFAERQNLFIDSYYFLKNQFIFGNGTTVLSAEIKGEILEQLESFKLRFGNVFMNSEDFVEVLFKLGKEFDIDYNASKVILEQKEILENKKEYIDKLINNLFINRTKLSPMYEKNKQLIKERK